MGTDTVANNAVGLIPIPPPFYHHRLTPECQSGGCGYCRRPWPAIQRHHILIHTCERCGVLFCDTCWARRVETRAERVVLMVGTEKELAHAVMLCAGCRQ
jgi:hypothetical protein